MTEYVDENISVIARGIIYQNMGDWRRNGLIPGEHTVHNNIALLCKLLGYKNLDAMLTRHTMEAVDTINALAGPNGYAVMRAIMAKKGLTHVQCAE